MRANQEFDQLWVGLTGDPRPGCRIDNEAFSLPDAAQPGGDGQQQLPTVRRRNRFRSFRLAAQQRVQPRCQYLDVDALPLRGDPPSQYRDGPA